MLSRARPIRRLPPCLCQSSLKLLPPVPSFALSIQDEAFSAYWRGLSEAHDLNCETRKTDGGSAATEERAVEFRGVARQTAHGGFEHMLVPFRGLIVDLVEDAVSPEVLEDLMEYTMVPLGLNTLQLSLVNGMGCSLRLESLEPLYHLVPTPPKHIEPLSDEVLGTIAAVGDRLGIELVPEISVTTRAIGWYHAGFLVECPGTLCSSSTSGIGEDWKEIANDVNSGALLPVVLHLIRKLRRIFRSGSFLHLGSDEREASRACWNETGRVPDYDAFEKGLSSLLEAQNWYNASSILRWENREGIVYPSRTGRITHYRYGSNPSPQDQSEESSYAGASVNQEDPGAHTFGSISITPDTDPWAIYQETRAWVADERTRPRGLLARIHLKDMKTKEHRDPHRHHSIPKLGILAFSIGMTSEIPSMNDSSALNDYIVDICAGNDQHFCPDPVPFQQEFTRIQHGTTSRGSLLCKAMTSSISCPVMRSQALPVVSDGDSRSNQDVRLGEQ